MFDGSLRRMTVALLVLAAAIGLAVLVLPMPHLVMVLNGAQIGAAVSVFVAYRKLVWHALGFANMPVTVAIAVISVLLLWAVVLLGVFNSLALRIIFEMQPPTGPVTILTRISGITAAVLQVAAPNMASGVFFTRDTRLLVRAAILGAAAALTLYLAQLGVPGR